MTVEEFRPDTRFLVVNKTNYNEVWAGEFLHTVLRPGMRAVILPLGYDEGWAMEADVWNRDFEESSERHEDLERPLRTYGIQDFSWIDFHRESEGSAADKLKDADICVLVGTDPAAAMERIEDLALEDALKQFDGILITLSEISHILEASFETGDLYERAEREGLGLLQIRFHMHYSETEEELRRMIRYLERDDRPLIVLSEKSGLYVGDGTLELLGDAFIAEDSDLDELYSLLD